MGVPTSVTIVGSTGLTGSAALSSLLSSPTPVSITALTRREIVPSKTPAAGTTLTTRILADLSQAATDSQPLTSGGGTYISCLGTKLAVVGDVKKQEQIDLVLNRNLAQRAKSDGAETIILVSSIGANASSWSAYSRMKGQLEDDVKAMEFERTIIIRPGMLLYEGQRDVSNASERYLVSAIRGLRSIGIPTTFLGVDGADVGAAIAQLATHPPPKGVTTIYNSDIVKLASDYRAAVHA